MATFPNQTQLEQKLGFPLGVLSHCSYDAAGSNPASRLFAMRAGVVVNDNVVTAVSSATLTLTASTTNYIEVDPTTGNVSFNTTGFTAGRIPLYTVVTGASSFTSITDQRSALRRSSGGNANPAFAVTFRGKPEPGEQLLLYVTPANSTFNLTSGSMADSRGYVATNPTTAAAVFKLQKNGSDIGTVSVSTAGVFTFSVSSTTSFAAGDRLTILAPDSQNAAMADGAFTLMGVAT